MKANVIFSGGPDSTAAALWAIEQGYEINLITCQFKGDQQYGELFSAMTIAKLLNLNHQIVDYRSPMQVFADDIHILMHAGTPQGFEDKSKPHLLPFGAGLILSFISTLSIYNDINVIIWGATKDDSFNSYEYTQDFADDVSALIRKSTGKQIKILVPFSNSHKPDILKTFIGREDLFANTWSCKTPVGKVQCGICKACIARRGSAKMISLQDNYQYSSAHYNHPFSEKQMKDYKSIPEDDLRIFSRSDPH